MRINSGLIKFQLSQIKQQKELAKQGKNSGEGLESLKASELAQKEEALLRKLRQRDQEVKAHEMAHLMAAGPYALSGARYETVRGPDGKIYAISGEVKIDTSPEKDPEKTLEKARTIRRAALAPQNPSPQDQLVALKASQMEAQALAELAKEKLEKKLPRSPQEISETYQKLQNR